MEVDKGVGDIAKSAGTAVDEDVSVGGVDEAIRGEEERIDDERFVEEFSNINIAKGCTWFEKL